MTSPHLKFPHSLSRLHCGTCNETTLHRVGVCIHCETEYHDPNAREAVNFGYHAKQRGKLKHGPAISLRKRGAHGRFAK